MNIRKIIHEISDPGIDLTGRMFRLIMLVGLLALMLGTVVGILCGEGYQNTLALVIAFIIFYAITYFSLRYNKVQAGAVLTSAVMIYIVLPFNFLTAGGIYGGAPIWFLLGAVYVCLVVENRIRYVLLISGYALFALCYFIAYNYPEMICQHTTQTAYIDSIMTLMVVSGLTCGMIIFQNVLFRSENALAQKQKKEIEELNKTQNRFFSTMSHEIRTPINTIIGLNEMILREEVSEEVAADAKSIQGASKMLLTLINDILDMSKIESGKMDIVPVVYDVGAMLSDIVNMIWARAKEKGLKFHVDVDQSMPSQMYGDEVRIKQILINVLNNAVKYTKEGSVTLSIQYKNLGGSHANIIYSVIDTGMGIKKENIPHLFSAFKRVDEEKNRYIEGTGLGLSIVKQLVELMHGEIAVNSVYTKGSTFVITLPQEIVGNERIGNLNIEERHALNTRQHYKQSFEAPKANILIVDDNETNLMVESKLLRATKVNIDTALSGKECLEKTFHKHYDVILMDHLMPEMDGIECFHEIGKQTGGLNQDTPVVILTANAGSESQNIYRREGFNGYLLKPVNGAQLEAELIKHLPRELVLLTSEEAALNIEESVVLGHRKKMLVMISTESVSDLPYNIISRHQVAVIPYRVVTEHGEFLDGVEIETDGVLSYIEEKGKTVYSKEPSVEEYEEFFAEQLTKAQYIIHIALASHVGKGYENATEAAQSFDNVYVINSGHLSSGMGLMVLHAVQCAEMGMNAEDIVEEIVNMKNKIKTSFIVNSTEYLAKAGRISSRVNSICNSFMIHPVIVLKNSRMVVGSIRIGTRDYAWKKYIHSVLSDVDKMDKKTIFITYAGLSNEELRGIEMEIVRTGAFDNIIYQKASPAISANCGPGSFGLLYVEK